MFGSTPGPTESEILAHATQALTSVLPGARVEPRPAALYVEHDERTVVWNLQQVIRLAQRDRHWREGLNAQARHVAAHFARPAVDSGASHRAEELRLRTAAGLPAELHAIAHVEPMWPGVVALVGSRTDSGRFSVASSEAVEALRHDPDWLARLAVATVGQGTTLAQLVEPLGQGIPVWTNTAHPLAAVALLIQPLWQQFRHTFDPLPPHLFAVAPAPNRFFVTPVPELVPQLGQLASAAGGVEDELLSDTVLRLDGDRWVPASG